MVRCVCVCMYVLTCTAPAIVYAFYRGKVTSARGTPTHRLVIKHGGKSPMPGSKQKEESSASTILSAILGVWILKLAPPLLQTTINNNKRGERRLVQCCTSTILP
uniref:Uncharacterized protein n=1 Tax=Amphora coffeiformis TaxID=265554 RepID=A0A7S3L091_9STRA|mmetsp:Transcript_5165/g.10188  ORF Transcript_5165/g.10188 Transcript_5165/m.10188 type:complete len:105 (+) Transcript_5165:318-632(+)